MSTFSFESPIISKGAITIGKAASLDFKIFTSKSALAENDNNRLN